MSVNENQPVYRGEQKVDYTGPGTVIPIGFGTANPGDGQTLYFGNHMARAPLTTAYVQRVRIERDGVINKCFLGTYANTAGTAEALSIYFRLKNTTDTLIATLAVSANERRFDATGLGIVVASGDWFEMKMVCPTWVTNPASMTGGGYVIVE